MMTDHRGLAAGSRTSFVAAVAASALWLNASEIWRYFVIVMPATRSYLSDVPDVAPMNLWVFTLWGVWDTILLTSCLLITSLAAVWQSGRLRAALLGGCLSWLFFPLFWLAMINMHLAKPSLLMLTLPLSLIEMIVTAGLFLMVRQALGGRM